MRVDEPMILDSEQLDTDQDVTQVSLAERVSLDDRMPEVIDSVDSYLREIGRVALLSAAAEVELAELMARGSAAAERLAQEILAPSLHRALQVEVRRGEEARHHLIQANL